MADRLPRGKCPVCGGDVALRKGGLVREHFGDAPQRVCPGSGQPAAKDKKDDDGRFSRPVKIY